MKNIMNTLIALGYVLLAIFFSLVGIVKNLISTGNMEESYREEFERQALASGKFAGASMARDEDGRYKDAALEKAWRIYVDAEAQSDTAW